MNNREIQEKADQLISQGAKCLHQLIDTLDPDNSEIKIIEFSLDYNNWYSKSIPVVKLLNPERFEEFCLLYRNPKRKEMTYLTYTVSDFIGGHFVFRGDNYMQRHYKIVSNSVMTQVNILRSSIARMESELSNLELLVRADVFDGEIQAARDLNKKDYIRAAGAICGVVLERHFEVVTKRHPEITISKKNPTISDYNDAFKDKVYDTIMWRHVQRLGDIRNLCSHKKEREPTKAEVEDLINGVDKIIHEVF